MNFDVVLPATSLMMIGGSILVYASKQAIVTKFPALRPTMQPNFVGTTLAGLILGASMKSFIIALVAAGSALIGWIVFDIARFYLCKRQIIEP